MNPLNMNSERFAEMWGEDRRFFRVFCDYAFAPYPSPPAQTMLQDKVKGSAARLLDFPVGGNDFYDGSAVSLIVFGCGCVASGE